MQKFGGSSLADADRIRQAAQRCVDLVRRGDQVVAVVSAQADTTDEMITAADEVAGQLSPREMDAFLSAGEQMSAGLMSMAIQSLGCSAISLTGWQAGILTDDHHGNAQVLGLSGDRIQRELQAGRIVVVAGFQGVTEGGEITTLGRGGSDTTAVALAAFLKADVCRIYTDVDGVYDKDPRKHPDAVKFDSIGYADMLALAQNGAQVLHDRCVALAQQHGVTIHVLSSFRPGKGTLVTDAQPNSSQN